jgi:hypothetical protein
VQTSLQAAFCRDAARLLPCLWGVGRYPGAQVAECSWSPSCRKGAVVPGAEDAERCSAPGPLQGRVMVGWRREIGLVDSCKAVSSPLFIFQAATKAPTLFINLYSGCAVQDVAMTLGPATLISRRVLVPRHVSPRRVIENILRSCSKRAFTWRNEVTSVSPFNIVVACL